MLQGKPEMVQAFYDLGVRHICSPIRRATRLPVVPSASMAACTSLR